MSVEYLSTAVTFVVCMTLFLPAIVMATGQFWQWLNDAPYFNQLGEILAAVGIDWVEEYPEDSIGCILHLFGFVLSVTISLILFFPVAALICVGTVSACIAGAFWLREQIRAKKKLAEIQQEKGHESE